MLGDYEDIFVLAMRLGETPRWFDEHGVPRFCDHHPSSCPDIYATEVALVLISCQRCGLKLPVQMSRGPGDVLRHDRITLTELVKDGTIHYGDPPAHEDRGDYCHAGCTMNCWDLRVIEFWCRSGSLGFEWARVPELEIELPDARDPERVVHEETP